MVKPEHKEPLSSKKPRSICPALLQPPKIPSQILFGLWRASFLMVAFSAGLKPKGKHPLCGSLKTGKNKTAFVSLFSSPTNLEPDKGRLVVLGDSSAEDPGREQVTQQNNPALSCGNGRQPLLRREKQKEQKQLPESQGLRFTGEQSLSIKAQTHVLGPGYIGSYKVITF